MAALRNEYIDKKNVKHNVEHLMLPVEDKANRERIIDELLYALTSPGKKITA